MDRDLYDRLCYKENSLPDMLYSVMESYRDYVNINGPVDLNGVNIDGEIRYTVLGLYRNIISSISTTVYNYLDVNDSLYFETSCTDPYMKCGGGINYFIRVYLIFELLKDNKLEIIWGTMAGNDMLKLKKEVVI